MSLRVTLNIAVIFTAILGAADTAGAQSSSVANEAEALGLWYKANVTRTVEWHVRDYSKDALIMADRTPRKDRKGHVIGKVRIERVATQTMNGMNWRSARIDMDTDCEGGALVIKDEGTANQTLVQTPTEPPKTKLTIFEGQNLKGASQTFDVPPGGFTTGPVGMALREICNRAEADARDKPGAPDFILLGHDMASLEAWRSSTLDTGAWLDVSYQPGSNRLGDGPSYEMHRAPSAVGKDKVRLEYRVEYIEPVLGATTSRAGQVAENMRSPAQNRRGRELQSSSRPIWLRSLLREYEFDCVNKAVRIVGVSGYEQHNLKSLIDKTSFENEQILTTAQPLRETEGDLRRFAAACGAAAG